MRRVKAYLKHGKTRTLQKLFLSEISAILDSLFVVCCHHLAILIVASLLGFGIGLLGRKQVDAVYAGRNLMHLLGIIAFMQTLLECCSMECDSKWMYFRLSFW